METQTDSDLEEMVHETSKLHVETQTDSNHELMIPPNEMDTDTNRNYVMCEGNKDDRFQPLIIKYKGIFQDSTGC